MALSGREEGVSLRLERWAYGNEFRSFAILEPRLPVKLVISAEGPLSTLGHLVGIHDIEVGEPEFDRHLRIVGDDSDAIRRLLTAKVRERLLALYESTRSFDARFMVSEGVISVQRLHVGPMPAGAILGDVPLLVSLAHALREAVR